MEAIGIHALGTFEALDGEIACVFQVLEQRADVGERERAEALDTTQRRIATCPIAVGMPYEDD